MGLHSHPVIAPAHPPRGVPRATLQATPVAERSPAALLRVLEAVHSERLTALRALVAVFADFPEYSAALIPVGGYPALSVARISVGVSRLIGVAYSGSRGEWWYAGVRRDGGDAFWLASVREPRRAAHEIIAELEGR
ncbi:hypothetical protein BKA00_007465 [Actinomadura coerulea]|uniref:Uncharacterized protein n=1 Tax=Actinomadura coerulea TaxID=46159 RepID=A0A7X0G6X8_9ACTN|nr:hypothetical protein [Actinomadura coerulea]MBB6400551.1 hypothetical protein [Actinomadura coerulea]GGQ08063.1 hypothetical protein GCM10010187_25200 [Actinomadura coerulea]